MIGLLFILGCYSCSRIKVRVWSWDNSGENWKPSKIIHARGTKKSVYDDYETTEIKLDSGYTEPVSDYEI